MEEQVKKFATTEAEVEELRDFIRRAGEEKGIDNFFLEIIRAKDNLKIGNLTKDEIGLPKLPVRTQLELADDCDLIPSMSAFAKDFRTNAMNTINTSLSKEGFLVLARITQNKKLLDGKKREKRRRGLFGRKEEDEEE
jgi:hypothetical protein